jgi:DNA mismatch endonuclease (patch repair protein)
MRVLGKPDVALPRKKKAVFIDGDFWHGRNYQQLVKRPAPEAWLQKISGNMERDKTQRQWLKDNGWQIFQVWDSDINRKRTREEALSSIQEFLLS